jgi:lipid-A-disaccharide synthase
MIACGEASGDLYAGALVDALRARDPNLDAFGFGGARMAGAGADLVGHYAGLSVTGLSEAARVLGRSWRMLRALEETARTRRPDVFVAIDFPDFNFRLLPALHRLGVPIVYYVSPQLWAEFGTAERVVQWRASIYHAGNAS